jgi:hypothetical protein
MRSHPVLPRPYVASLLLRSALIAAPLFAALPAHADVPPPEGTKFVSFAYAVDGLEAHPDFVLLGYPSSATNGRPMDEYAELGKQPTTLGRRGGSPAIYAVKRSDYDAWKATLGPLGPDAPLVDNPTFKAFFTSDKVVRCDESPKPSFALPSSDPRDEVVERFRVVSVSATGCDLERVAADATGSSASGGEFASPPADATASDPSAPSAAPTHGGCAGCALAGEAQEGGLAALVAAISLAFGLASRRARRGNAR